MASAGVMAGASIGTSIIGGVLGAIGAKGSADASANMFNFKAGIADLNASIAKQNAAWAINSGGIKANEVGLKAGQQIADTKVLQSRSGFDVNSGSASSARQTQSDVAKYDQGIIRSDAAHTAYGYETQAAADTAEAGIDRSAASGAEDAGKLGVLSSIIGAAGSVASKWTQGNTLGIGSGTTPSGVGTFDPNNWGAAPSWST